MSDEHIDPELLEAGFAETVPETIDTGFAEEGTPRPSNADIESLPQPIYRLKLLHSSETFHGYFVTEGTMPHFRTLRELEHAFQTPAQTRQETVPVSPSPLEGDPSDTPEAVKTSVPASIPPHAIVVTPTKYGRDLAEVLGIVLDFSVVQADELMLIERPATLDDYRRYLENLEKEKTAFELCRQRIEAHQLPMKLVAAHYLLEESKILFFFTAETRVDFRELVKDLVGIFHSRIELRQIGVRDEARVTGGCGVCGRVLCCHGISDKLNPVSIKMAKDQNLSLNSLKISGPCGRLLCCLSYEYQFYRDARRELPNEGVRLVHDGTLFKVIEVNVLSGRVRLSGEDGRMLDIGAERLKYNESHWSIIDL